MIRRLYLALALISNGLVLGWLSTLGPDGVVLAITGAIVGGLAAGAASGGIGALLGGGSAGGGGPSLGDLLEAQSFLPDLQPLFQGPRLAGDLTSSLFSNPRNRKELKRFLKRPVGLTEAEKAAASGLNQLGPGIQSGIENLEGLAPFAQELVETGFETDLQPIVDLEQRRFGRETIPGLAERFPSLGLSGSGAQGLLSSAGVDLGTELGSLQVALDEASAGRRVQGLGIAPSIFAAPSTFGIEAFGALGSAGEQARLRKESTRRGARLQQSLGFLTGLETQQKFLQPGFAGPTVTQGGGLGGIGASLIPQAVGALGQGFFSGIGDIASQGLQGAFGSLFGGGGGAPAPSITTGQAASLPGFTGDFGAGTGITGGAFA